MFKYIRTFFAFILPILGKAALQSAADELAKVAYPPTERRRYPAYNRYQRPAPSRVGRYDDMPLKDAFKAAANDLDKYHDVLMVAFDITGPNMATARQALIELMPSAEEIGNTGTTIDSWWIADDKAGTSDCDSAVFVRQGNQEAARKLLREHGLA